MTNGVAAAMILSADILGRQRDWAKPVRRRITGPPDVLVLTSLRNTW